jgi:uncharacterized protein GlcG (DUF336 family)
MAKGLAMVQELGFAVAIADVDEAGHLIACHRMDGAMCVTPEMARAKANARVAFHATILDLEQRFTARQLFAGDVAALGRASPGGEGARKRVRVGILRW